MDISILISTYRRPELLAQTLESFCTLDVSELTWEILVVDNAGDGTTKEVVERFYNKIPVKYLVETKKGKNNALNYVISLAKGELFVFSDDDVIVDKKWLKEIYEGAKRWSEYSVFGGRVLPNWPSNQLNNDDFLKIIYSVSGWYAVANWELPEGMYAADKIFGANMAIRRNIFKKGLLFNTDIGPCGCNYIVGSETEILIRLEKLGFKAIYLPNAVVYHYIRPEQMKVSWLYERAFKYGRSDVYFDKKYNGAKILGIPRYLIRQFFEFSARRIATLFSKDNNRIELGIKYHFTKGKIYQFYQYRKGAIL